MNRKRTVEELCLWIHHERSHQYLRNGTLTFAWFVVFDHWLRVHIVCRAFCITNESLCCFLFFYATWPRRSHEIGWNGKVWYTERSHPIAGLNRRPLELLRRGEVHSSAPPPIDACDSLHQFYSFRVTFSLTLTIQLHLPYHSTCATQLPVAQLWWSSTCIGTEYTLPLFLDCLFSLCWSLTRKVPTFLSLT